MGAYGDLVKEHNDLNSKSTKTDIDTSRIWEIRFKIQKECYYSGWEDGYKGCDFDYKEPPVKTKQDNNKLINNSYNNSSMEVKTVLKKCTIEGNIIKLPNEQLDRNVYQEVKKSLELIGGKWKGGKVFGFVFNEDPTELFEQIANGEKRNLKKEFQFYATPAELADELVSYANIHNSHKILEPSAGQGAIINAIHRISGTMPVDYCETMGVNLTFLQKMKNVNPVGVDFLEINEPNKYDRIIANPPFSKNQDIQHVYKMHDCLKEGGRLVSVVSKHWQNCDNKTEAGFKQWLKVAKAEIHEIDAGVFKESGTMIASCILIIDK
jgi:hypothetical protein